MNEDTLGVIGVIIMLTIVGWIIFNLAGVLSTNQKIEDELQTACPQYRNEIIQNIPAKCVRYFN